MLVWIPEMYLRFSFKPGHRTSQNHQREQTFNVLSENNTLEKCDKNVTFLQHEAFCQPKVWHLSLWS